MLALAGFDLYKPRHLTRGPWLLAVRWLVPQGRELTGPRRLNRRTKQWRYPIFLCVSCLEAGVHFGHQSHRWNPKMADYIFGARNNIHIIDLAQTVPLLHRALQAVSDTVAKGGRILFVGTKRQAQDGVAEAAKRSAQYFVNSRWLGGTLTNWKTISGSIKRLRHLDEVLDSGDANAYTKKERLTLQRERDKLDRSLGGIKDMGGLPDMIFVIDTNKEDIAIEEAQRLNIPVAADRRHQFATPRASPMWCPATTTPAAPSRCIAIWLPGRRSTAFRARRAIPGIDVGASAAAGARGTSGGGRRPAGFQGLAGPRGVADDLKKLTGVSGAIEKKFNDLGIFHYWQLAELDHDTAHKIGEEVGLAEPRRWLGRPGQGADRGSRITNALAGAFRPSTSNLSTFLMVDGGEARAGRAAVALTGKGRATMATITAAMVKDLRESTGAGMMDCKAGAHRERRRHAGGDRSGCARRACRRPPRRPAASPPKA